MTTLNYPSVQVVRERPTAREAGLSMLEISIGGGILIALAVFIMIQMGEGVESVNSTRAVSEINSLMGASRNYRTQFAQGGSYAGISLPNIISAGLPTGGIVSDNVFGEAVTLAPNSANTDAIITYPTGDEDTCSALLNYFARTVGGTTTYIKGVQAASCTGTPPSTLSVTVD